MSQLILTNIIYNLGNLCVLIALTVKDILWLRLILISAQLALLCHGLMTERLNVVSWYLVFLMINIIQLVQVIKERKFIALPTDLEEIYQQMFANMDRSEFLYFWSMGDIHERQDEALIIEGAVQKDMSLLLSGSATIIKNNKKVTGLNAGDFMGEMSFLTANPASASVMADGPVRYISWEQNKLKNLETLNAKIYTKIHSILGKNLARKIQNSTQ